MNLLINSKEDANEKRLYQSSKDGIICGTAFKIGDVNFNQFGYNGHLFLTARHCVEEYDEKMFYNPWRYKENTGEYIPLTIFSIINGNTLCPTHPDLIVKHPKLDIAAIIVPNITWSYLGNTDITRYKEYDIGQFNLSDPPHCLKIDIFRSEYNNKKGTMYFCKDTGKNIKITQIDKDNNLIRLKQNIKGGWSGSPAVNTDNKKVIGIVSKGFYGKDGSGTVVYFNKNIHKWINKVKNNLRFCFSRIDLNIDGIIHKCIIHNRQIKVERNIITNEIMNVICKLT